MKTINPHIRKLNELSQKNNLELHQGTSSLNRSKPMKIGNPKKQPEKKDTAEQKDKDGVRFLIRNKASEETDRGSGGVAVTCNIFKAQQEKNCPP